MKLHWKPPVKKATFPIFYFIVWLLDGQEKVTVDQVADMPPESTDDNSSVLLFQFDLTGEHGVGIHITWYPYKPVPDSPARREGLLAVLKDIIDRLPEESKPFFKNQMIAIGHASGAKATIHDAEADDEPS